MTLSRERASGSRRLLWILGGAVVLLTVLLAASLLRPADDTAAPTATDTTEEGAQGDPSGQPEASGQETDAEQQEREAREALEALARRTEGDYTAIGEVDAPLVLIEYADYRCPFCGAFARETLPLLVDEYVDAGLLRVEWRDLPVFGEESFNGAVAARAAGEQGRFWEFHAAVFANEDPGHQPLPRERLLELAAEVDVPDLAAFEAALDDPALIQAVAADAQEAQSLGIRSTPTFIVGQEPVVGAQPADAFRQVIEAELARKGW